MTSLGHVNIRTSKYEETISFFEAVLGFQRVVSPVNPDPGQNTWLLDAAGKPCVHVNSLSAGESPRAVQGCLDHIAFNCMDKAAAMSRLRAMGLPFNDVQTRIAGVTQLNIRDPNGIRIELTFGHELLDAAIVQLNPGLPAAEPCA